jgi:hypothetical protein
VKGYTNLNLYKKCIVNDRVFFWAQIQSIKMFCLMFCFFKMEHHSVAQAGPKLLGSIDFPASAS